MLYQLLLAGHGGVPAIVDFLNEHVGSMGLLLPLLLELTVQDRVPTLVKRDLWTALVLVHTPIDHDTANSMIKSLRTIDCDAYVLCLAEMILERATVEEKEQKEDELEQRAVKKHKREIEVVEIDIDPTNPLDLLEVKMHLDQQAAVQEAPEVAKEVIELTPEQQAKAATIVKGINRLSSFAVDAITPFCDDMMAMCLDITTGPEPIFERLTLAAQAMQLSLLPEDVLAVFCTKLLDAQWSLRTTMHLIKLSLLDKVQSSPTALSRGLVQIVIRLCKDHPTVISNELLVPIMTSPELAAKPPQCEIATRIIRDGLALTSMNDLLLKLCQDRMHTPFHTTDRMLLVLQTLFNLKADLQQETMDMVIDAMDSAVNLHAKSIKFATVLFTIVAKYSALCRSQKELLLELVAKCQSSMAKTALRAIEKL